MAELVDALVLGSSVYDVQVQVLLSALNNNCLLYTSEYLADIRASMIDQLEHTTVIEPDGTRRKLQVRH